MKNQKTGTEKEQPGNYGILLLNMGGPSSEKEIYGYLRRIFSDPAIISLPGFLRFGLAGLIAFFRKNIVKKRYKLVGGRSPLGGKTKTLVQSLEHETGLPVAYAMRYSNPFIGTALNILQKRDVNHYVVLPLYPQFSNATTLSSLKDLKTNIDDNSFFTFISSHFQNRSFYELNNRMLKKALKKSENKFKTAILFVAHSIPVKHIKDGDPYVEQVKETVELITKGDISFPFSIAFQSRLGPLKWQGPSLDEELERLISKNIEQLIVHPVSFALENLETLYDLDIVFREKCLTRGIRKFIRVSVPGEHPDYVKVLSSIINSKIKGQED